MMACDRFVRGPLVMHQAILRCPMAAATASSMSVPSASNAAVTVPKLAAVSFVSKSEPQLVPPRPLSEAAGFSQL
jgi:hypothetical protein